MSSRRARDGRHPNGPWDFEPLRSRGGFGLHEHRLPRVLPIRPGACSRLLGPGSAAGQRM